MRNFEFFIARKMIFGKSDAEGKAYSGTKVIIRIAVLGIILGLAVMILAQSIVTGFQSEIRSKVVGFGSHITISGFYAQNTFDQIPIKMDQSFYPELNDVPGVRRIQIYATKPGILKTNDNIQGVLAKGIGTDFDWSFFQKNMKEGVPIAVNDTKAVNEIVISKPIAQKLQLKLDDNLLIVFIKNERERIRKLRITGIYETGLEQFDQSVILMDIKHIQRVWSWNEDEVSGFEVLLEKYEDLDRMDDYIYEHIGHDFNSVKITDQNQELFGWLELQDINVVIIIILMILVSAINMISALLILILERTNMIGLLKAMGAQNWSIQKIFLYNAGYLIGIGLFWGNVVGISIGLLQREFGLIKLPQESYYISTVPINLDFTHILFLNLGSLLAILIVLLLPSLYVMFISPIRSIKFN